MAAIPNIGTYWTYRGERRRVVRYQARDQAPLTEQASNYDSEQSDQAKAIMLARLQSTISNPSPTQVTYLIETENGFGGFVGIDHLGSVLGAGLGFIGAFARGNGAFLFVVLAAEHFRRGGGRISATAESRDGLRLLKKCRFSGCADDSYLSLDEWQVIEAHVTRQSSFEIAIEMLGALPP